MVYQWVKNKLNAFFSQACLLCGEFQASSTSLCNTCKQQLPRMVYCCPQCGIALPDTTSTRCGQCIKSPPPIDQTRCIFSYEPPISFLMQQLKLNQALYLADTLGKEMANYLSTQLTSPPELIIPVPLHIRRLHSRGYNQALELSRPISKELNIPINWQCCERIKNTQSQAQLAAKARKTNVKNAFIIKNLPEVKYVAIVDDTMTTGHTVWALAALLKQAGVQRVDAWICARAHLN